MRNLLYRHHNLIVNKFTGAGGTPYAFRIMLEMALTMNLPFNQYSVITGLNEDKTIEFMETRLKPIVERKHADLIRRWNVSKGILELKNGKYFKSYPTGHISVIRGEDDIQCIFADEDGFFNQGAEQELEMGVERYKLKTDPFKIRISTPNGPQGLYHKNFTDAEKGINDYYPLTINWKEGVKAQLFTEEEIRQLEHDKPKVYRQEYNNEFVSPEGAVFLEPVEPGIDEELL